jgi:CRP/FNR family transcriptional regulator, cyclic AMP receptor protein
MQLNIDWLARELKIQPLSAAYRKVLAEVFELEFVARGMPIIHQGTPVQYIYLLHSGSLRIVHKNSSHIVTLDINTSSRIFGEISFFDNVPASADVIAEQSCEIYKISGKKFQWLMQNHADLAMKLMGYVVCSMGGIIRRMDNSRR